MTSRTALFAVVLLIATGCNQSTTSTPSHNASASSAASAARSAEPAPAPEPEDNRTITQYSAKQALARLEIQLKREGKPAISKLWNAIPERSAVYGNRDKTELSWVVGGWVFYFENVSGSTYEARVNCFGEVKLAKDDNDLSKMYPKPIKPEELVVDNRDAHKIVLKLGGEATRNNQGGWLMTIQVDGGGVRPVWAGACWIMADKQWLVAVDAQTGQVYRLEEDGKELKGVTMSGSAVMSKEWNGGFVEDSTEAIIGRSDSPYMWPNCYRDMISAGYVYNFQHLKESLRKEEAKSDRPASSWMTTGIINAALGNWGKGISDLNKAVELEPQSQNFKECRGFLSLVIRDFETAEADIKPDAGGEKAVESREIFNMLQGKSDSGGLMATMHNFQTEAGFIPLELNIGMEPFKSESLEKRLSGK